MATKAYDLQFRLPIRLCYEMLRAIGSEVGWEVRAMDSNDYRLQWVQREGNWVWGLTIHIHATMRSLDSNTTHINVEGEVPGTWADVPGHIPKALAKLLGPFERWATEAETLLSNGLMCPTCGRKLQSGAQFCPIDGTSIARNCPRCGCGNIPSAQFCAKCGIRI